MATMDLWVGGETWGNNDICFQQKVPFDMARFHADDVYAERMCTYIQTALGYLAEELAAISLMETPVTPNPSIDHPSTWRAIAQVD